MVTCHLMISWRWSQFSAINHQKKQKPNTLSEYMVRIRDMSYFYITSMKSGHDPLRISASYVFCAHSVLAILLLLYGMFCYYSTLTLCLFSYIYRAYVGILIYMYGAAVDRAAVTNRVSHLFLCGILCYRDVK